MREGDIVMFLSEYQRQLYIKLFPEHLNKRNTIVCNPLLNFLPKINNRYDGKEMVIGWIGRMFDAKNFDQALNIFIGLSKETHESVKFIAAGIAEPKYEERKVHKYLEEKGINPSNYLHSDGGQFINRQEIGKILGKINLLLFPSIGNMESLGRVVIEANNAGIPVIAANHGAMPEILQKSSLVNVSYSREEISLNYPSSLGKIDEEEAIKKCKHYKKLDIGDNSSYKNHDKIFFEILYGNQTSKITYLEKNVRDFIKNVQINLNGDFSLNSVSLIKKAVSFMQECCETSQLDIGETSHRLRERLNFNPSLFIK
jgi:hypothetical protein